MKKKRNSENNRIGLCFCGKKGKITQHHIIPRSIKDFRISETLKKRKKIIMICDDCHVMFHRRYSNQELRGFSVKKIILLCEQYRDEKEKQMKLIE